MRLVAKVEHDAVKLFRDQRTDIGAVRIQKGEHDRLAPELCQRHWLAELIGQAESWRGNATKIGSLQPSSIRSRIAGKRLPARDAAQAKKGHDQDDEQG